MIAVCALLLALVAGDPDPGEVKALASKRFDDGLALVDRGDFAGAVVAFKDAYNLRPHPAVLLNLGQAYVALDRPKEAADALQRYLAEMGADLAPARRAAVEAQLRAQEQRLRREQGDAVSEDRPERTAPAPVSPAPPRPPPAPSLLIPVSPPAPPLRGEPDHGRASGLGPALLATVGIGLAGAAVAVRLSNDGRHRRWTSEVQSLEKLAPSTQPGEQALVDARRRAANDELGAIERTDTTAGALAVSGAVVVAAAAIWWWRMPRVEVAPTSVAMTWTW